MRIAMLGQKGLPAKYGGVEKHVHDLSTRLVKDTTYEVTVYARKWYTSKDIKEYKGVKIKHLPSIHTKHLDTISHVFLATLDAIKNKYDVIHYHGVGPSLISWIPRIFAPKIKIVTTLHSLDRKHQKWGFIARLFLKIGEWTACRFAHSTIAISHTIAQYCRDVYDIEAVFIPYGVSDYQKANTDKEIKKWGLEKGKYILALTRLIPHKGVHYLIAAWKELEKTNPVLVRDLKLVIAGDGYYTENYVAKLKAMSAADKNIIFTGTQTGPAWSELLSHAKLLVHPSENEGLPHTVLEAMSHNLPVLVSDIPEHKELIDNPQFLFRNGNVKNLEQQMEKILQLDDVALATVGEKNKKIVDDNFNWDKLVQKIDRLYRS